MKKYALNLALMLLIPAWACAQSFPLLKTATKSTHLVSPLESPENVQTASRNSNEIPKAFQDILDYAEALAYDNSEASQQIDTELSKPLEISSQKWQSSSSVVSKVAKSKSLKAVTVTPGDYIAKDFSYTNSNEVNSVMQLFQDEDGAYYMSNIYSFGDTISITINPTDGTVSIPAQTIYTHSTYGEVIMCPIDFSTSKYSPNGTISGTIDESGVITLSSWGIFVKEGSYAGAYFNIFTSSSWVPTNATITSVKADGTEASYNVLVEQTTANEIRIINIIGNGAAVSALITSSKDVKISPQQLAYSSYYGYFYCYPMMRQAKQ